MTMWFPAVPNERGWGSKVVGRNTSVVDGDVSPSSPIKASAGRIIRIVNNNDQSVQCRVLLNLRTTQPFEEVLEDLGQVLKMSGTKRMFTASGEEVYSFSQLRNEYADVETFFLDSTPRAISPVSLISPPPIRRSRSSNGIVAPVVQSDLSHRRQRARSKSRPRTLYAADSDVNHTADSSSDYIKEEPIKMNIRGWRRTFYPPAAQVAVDNAPPDKKLQLQWVHGYRGRDTHKNLWILPSGELMYFVAAVVILYDREEETQRHYTGHTEDILSLDVHPSRELVASGQRAGADRKSQAHVRIWSTDSLQTLYVFGMGEFMDGVTAVAFSQLNGGSYILATDASEDSILSVWQWQWGHLLGKVSTLQPELSGAVFHPLDDNLIITYGRGHMAFWHRRKDGCFERTDMIKQPNRTCITAVQFEPEGDVITADSDGFISIYSVDAEGMYFIRMEFEAHIKDIGCLLMLPDGTLLSGGEKDRKIAAWDSLQNYKLISDTKLLESAGGVRTISPQRPGRDDGNIYVGTTKNNIVEGSLQRRFNEVIFGHGRQLYGLAVHPEDELFATAGMDKSIVLWRKHKLVWSTQVDYECISLAFHPYGAAIAVGTTVGNLLIINAETSEVSATVRVCAAPLNCIAFNQIGDQIAMGSKNGCIYLFRVSREGFTYKRYSKIRGTLPLQHIDWSEDGNFLQTVSSDFDLLFWDIRSLSPERSPILMRDVKWLTHNCTVGYLVAGMWNNRYYSTNNTRITTSNRSSSLTVLASGDAEGHIRIFKYPCISPRAEYYETKVYSGAIACLRFLYGDTALVSVGGTDASLMIWNLVDE